MQMTENVLILKKIMVIKIHMIMMSLKAAMMRMASVSTKRDRFFNYTPIKLFPFCSLKGPLPAPAPITSAKRRRGKRQRPVALHLVNSLNNPFNHTLVVPNAELYLANLPSAEMYEKSYMHRDVVIFGKSI